MMKFTGPLSTLLLASVLVATGTAFVVVTPTVSKASQRSPILIYHASSVTSLGMTEASENSGADESPVGGEETSAADDSPTDILNSPAFLERKREVLQADIAAIEEDIAAAQEVLEANKAEWKPQVDDLQKEYANIQERMNAQTREGSATATVAVAREMLKLMDNYDRAFGAVKPDPENEVQCAVEAQYKESYVMLEQVFEKLGIETVETLGTEFDYEVHQAVMQKPSEEYEEGIVCDELQKGYKLGDKLIRAAMVAVAF